MAGRNWDDIARRIGEFVGLNIEQQPALASRANCAVIAAAGSGKTRVLTARYVLHLIADSIRSPEAIVAITFTDNAAAEMRGRVRSIVNTLLEGAEFEDFHRLLYDAQFWLPFANISTIHSFCFRLLNMYPLEAGIVPGFQPMEEARIASLREELINTILREINNKTCPVLNPQECILLARHLGRKRISEALNELLCRQSKIKRGLEFIRDLVKDDLIPHQLKKDNIPIDLEITVMQIIARLLDNAILRLETMKQQESGMEYDELLSRAFNLVASNKTIRESLTKTFRYFLIDEFQDTNPVQWHIIRELSLAPDGSLIPDRIFIVGDPKQSIYGFRDADIRIFNSVCEQITQPDSTGKTSKQFMMSRNYRARQCLIDFSNAVFPHIMRQDITDNEFEAPYEPFVYTRDVSDDFPGSVEILLSLSNDSEEHQSEFDLIAQRIKQIVNGEDTRVRFEYKDIAILLRWTTRIISLEAALRYHNIPYVSVGSIGFYKRQEIWDFYHLFSFLLNENDDMALAGVLRSPLFAFSDNLLYKVAQVKGHYAPLWERLEAFNEMPEGLTIEESEQRLLEYANHTLKRLHTKAFQTPVASLLDEILEATGYLLTISTLPEGKYILANIDKLLIMAQQAGSLTEFVETMKLSIEGDIREGEAQPELTHENAVQIMTIHKAKGLEFPVVFLPFLDQNIYTAEQRQTVKVDDTWCFGFKMKNPAKGMEDSEMISLRLINESMKRRILAEEKRMLYVGVTRARDMLILSGKSTSSKQKTISPLRFLETALPLDTQSDNLSVIDFSSDGRSWMIPIKTSIKIDEGMTQQTEPTPGDSVVDELALLCGLKPIKPRIRQLRVSATELEHHFQEQVDLIQKRIDPEQEFIDEYYRSRTEYQRTSAMILGSVVHAALELLFNNPTMSLDDSIAVTLAAYPELAADEKKSIFSRAREHVSHIQNSHLWRFLTNSSVYYTELPFMLNISPTITLSGKIDLLYQNETGLWQIVDYKTDMLAESIETLREYAEKRYRIQVLCYAMFLGCMFPDQKEYRASLFFTASGEIIDFTFSRNMIESEKKRIRSHLETFQD